MGCLMNWTAIQTALRDLGFDPGAIDGIPGRRTIRAVKQAQAGAGLTVDGIVGPRTLELLLGHVPAVGSDLFVDPPWMVLAEQKKGLIETKDNAELRKFLKSDGATLGDPTKFPWCGDFEETIIALTLPDERLPTNPYLARNWQTFGVASDPLYGCPTPFWRTSKSHSTNGHIANLVGINKAGTKYRVIGGNQSNSISESWIAVDRSLGARRPVTWKLPLRPLPVLEDDGSLSTNEA